MRHLRVRLAIASRGGSRSKPGGRTTRTPCGPRPVEGKWPGMPRGAPTGAYYKFSACSARHTPRIEGMEKRRALPRPTQVRDRQSVGFFALGYFDE